MKYVIEKEPDGSWWLDDEFYDREYFETLEALLVKLKLSILKEEIYVDQLRERGVPYA